MLSVRANGATYTNDKGKPIFVSVADSSNGYNYSCVFGYVEGMQIAAQRGLGDMKNTVNQASILFIVPTNSTYSASFCTGRVIWQEFW